MRGEGLGRSAARDVGDDDVGSVPVKVLTAPVVGLSGTLCKWRDLRVRGQRPWAGEDHVHDYNEFRRGVRGAGGA
jgi:hypothetical protein